MTKLSSCKIRLAQDLKLRFLAEEASLVATRVAVFRQKPFPFLRLPTEVQLTILSFTDVVTPHCEVEVDMAGKYTARDALPDLWEDHQRYNHAIRFLRCPQDDDMCLCRRVHSSYSNCRCWVEPTSLFLVSKHFWGLANEVFFTHNRFVVMPPRMAEWRCSSFYYSSFDH